MYRVFFNFQGNALFGVLAFLGTAAALLLAAGLLVLLLATGRRRLAGQVALLAGVGVAVYAAALLLLSARSRPQVAERGEEKYFCEVDCHLAYSVTDVRRAKTLAAPGGAIAARGTYSLVTLQTRFDADTISCRRGDMPLNPNPRRLAVVDAEGREFLPVGSSFGEDSVPLTRPLRPGESYTTRLVFDLPDGARDPRLLVTERDFVTRFLIGHENSFLHAKTFFRLDPHSTRTSALAVPISPVAASRTLTTTRKLPLRVWSVAV